MSGGGGGKHLPPQRKRKQNPKIHVIYLRRKMVSNRGGSQIKRRERH